MPPKIIGDRPMTGTERVRRHRAKLRRGVDAKTTKIERNAGGTGTAAGVVDAWQMDAAGVHFTLPGDPDSKYFLIAPPDGPGSLYRVFEAVAGLIEPIGSSESLDEAKSIAMQHKAGKQITAVN